MLNYFEIIKKSIRLSLYKIFKRDYKFIINILYLLGNAPKHSMNFISYFSIFKRINTLFLTFNLNNMKRILLLLLVSMVGLSPSWAQRTVTGTVTAEEDGSPIPGVNVVVKGTSSGTATDVEGRYTIDVPGEDAVLVFSFIGYATEEITVGNQSVIDVAMVADVKQLTEVVVTALGISREKRALGYSVQEVGSEEINKSNTSNVINALSGKIAGVRINSSTGAAGGSTFIEIRGSSSILGNNQPLFVVDGIPIRSGGGAGGVAGVALSDRSIDLNPEDIENISVLKGGAATVLYGMRAANGVVLITTKKGAKKKGLSVNFSSSVAFDKISHKVPIQDKYAQGSVEYAKLLESFGLRRSSYFDPDQTLYNAISWGPLIDTLRYTKDPNYVPGDLYYRGATTPMEDYIKYWDPNGRIVGMSSPFASNQKVMPYDRYEYFQTGVSYRNSINMSGGNDVSTFFFSASNESTKGIVPNNEFNRATFKLNASQKLSKSLKVTGSVNYMNTKGDRIQQGSNVSGVMLGLLRTPPTFDNSYGWKFPDGRQRTYRNGTGYDNPYWISNEILYRDDVHRIISFGQVDWDITDYLKLTYRVGIDWYSRYVKNYFAIYSNDRRDGYSSSGQTYASDFNQDIYLNFNKDLGDKFNLNFTVGSNLFNRYSRSTSSEANGLIIPDFYNVANTADNRGYEGTSDYKTLAYYGDFGFSFSDMIFLNLTGRYEESTTLPEKNNGFFYPSASVGFVFTELGGLKNSNFLSFGKLRGSYAITANIPSPYRTSTYFVQSGAGDGWTSGVSFPFRGTNGYTLSGTMGNPDLMPETSTNMEIGIELNFFMNRIGIDAAYFSNKTEDILLFVPVAPSSGYGTRYMNAASMTTTGFELLLNATIIKSRNFTWDFVLNWANPNSIVDELAPGVDNVFLGGFTEPQVRAVAGERYRSIYGTDWLRDSQGRLIIEDDPNSVLYGHPMPDPQTKLLGSVQPDWTMGITNTFSFKGLTVSGLIDIKQGGQMWNGTKGALYFFGAHKDTENRTEDYVWENGVMGHTNADGEIVHYDSEGNEVPGPGDPNSVTVKLDESWRWWDGYGSGFTGPSSPYIEDAGWVRLRELTVGYNFRDVISNVNWLQSLELYFTGRNLWISTDYTGIDPETSLLGSSNAQGFDYFNMPGTRSYIVGLRVGF